jgi:hypothetical protein
MPIHAYRIPDVCKVTGLGRTSIYAAIKSGALTARRWNRCTIVLGDDLATFLNNLPRVRPTHERETAGQERATDGP